jgi:hypothetical protein
MEIKEREVVQKNYSKPYIKTELDSLLDELINKFKLYQLKLKDKAELIQIEFDLILEKYALKSDEKSLKDLKKHLVQKNNRINEIYKEKDLFINKLNELFLRDINRNINGVIKVEQIEEPDVVNQELEEAMEVLLALGYKQSEVDKVVKKIGDESLDTNGYVKKALSLIVK